MKYLLILPITLTLSACNSTKPVEQAQPALLESTSSEVRQEITKAVRLSLNGNKALVALNAFTASSELVLQKNVGNGVGNNYTRGSLLGRPDVFRFNMIKQGNGCYLVRQGTGQKVLLNGVRCHAI
ncbi:hypothetical protein EOL70_02230 [Leucothrix sargassi]|nr:hypothetical protein EOL70_02230 [Leucothrix sargassi]